MSSNTPIVVDIPVTQIRPGDNDRKVFSEDGIAALAESIVEHGLIQPITVIEDPDNTTRYRIVAGERRWRAHLYAGLRTIRAIVANFDEKTASAVMLLENLNRQDLNPIEKAQAFRERLDAGWTLAELVKVTGYKAPTIRNHLALLDLVPEVRDAISKELLPVGHAVLLRRLPPQAQRAVLRRFLSSGGMTKILFRRVVEDLERKLAEQAQEALFSLEAYEDDENPVGPPYGPEAVELLTWVPRSDSLPQVVVKRGDFGGAIIARYLEALIDNGLLDQAEAVGNLYLALVEHRKVTRGIKDPLTNEWY